MAITINLSAGQISELTEVGPGARITVTGSAYIEYAQGGLQDAKNGVLSWSRWPNGTANGTCDTIRRMTVRAIATGSAVVIIEEGYRDAVTDSGYWQEQTAQMVTDANGNNVPVYESTYNFSASNGKVSATSYAVSPSSASALVYVGKRLSMSWSTTQTLSPGGWVSTREDVLSFPSASTVDKAVVQLAQVNISSNSTIDKLLGHESELASIAAGAAVNSYAAYYVPNLSGVANIGNVAQFFSFACDHVNSSHKNAGKYVNAGLVEYAPPYHPGLVTGRYYSAPHDTIAANAVSENVIYFVPVYVPQRATVTKLGFTVTTLGAGNARLAIYRAKNGVPEALMVDAGTISVGTTGDKEITISTLLESGTYYLAANFSVACSVNWHQGSQAIRQGMFGSSTSSLSGAAQECGGYFAYAFGAFPATANVMTYNPQQAEPHLWFRV